MTPSAGEHDLSHPSLTRDADIRQAYSEDASGLIGVPDAVARPASASEVADLIAWCADRRVPVTPQGLRSSTVGSPLAMGGVALSLEKLDRLIDIDPVRRLATAGPGINLGLFKKAVTEAGLFFPPDPTSENECTLGGAVMTNASGARSYRYGAIRPWVEAIDLILGDGRPTTITRSHTTKNTVGYFGFQNPVDLIVGSEGTLGVATRLVVRLLPEPPGHLAGMAFFRELPDAVVFVQEADRKALRGGHRAEIEGMGGKSGVPQPRCLELFDEGSLAMIRPEAGSLNVPAAARAAIYFEEECEPESLDERLESWLALIEACQGLADDTIVVTNDAQESELKRLRHALPSLMNERGRAARAFGGMKLGTDWAVPLESVGPMIEEATRLANEVFGGFYIRYGHLGNGHPHFNLLAKDAAELTKARKAIHAMCLHAVSLGGTVTAEHGVGKLKREYVGLQYPGWVIDAMRSVKRALDPAGILAPGNIFE
ncbi:MAG: FAD-binding oxidoreductase [Candidatus Eisenbacteria bacterium]|nr:FAD-binding oxidoreductase [Candidatus Eisenbacteria bacterium]